MLVITAIVGNSFRNDRSLSSASATMNSPLPSRALLPKALNRPPITAVGSRPHRSSTTAIIEVVVVLPCAPATAIEKRSRISSASISARGITGICRRAASTTSGFVGRTADEITTTSASPSASCPSETGRRSVPRRAATIVSFSWEPQTMYPRYASSSAMPLIPIPPTPTKCTCLVFPNTAEFSSGSSPHELQRPTDDHLRCIGPGQRSRRGGDALPPRTIGGHRQNPFRERRAAHVALQQHLRGAARGKRLGVLPLVIVGRRRQRNENRRPAPRRDLRKRRRAGAADDHVRRSELPSPVVAA